MGIQLTASTGSAATSFYMRAKDGTISLQELDRANLAEVEDGEKLCAIVGYSDTFALTSEQYGEKQMIRLLFRVLDGQDKGSVFTCMYGATLGVKAKLNEVVSAAIGRAIKPGESIDFDELLGTKLHLLTRGEMNARGYVVIRHGSARVYKEPAKASAKPAAAASADIWGEDL